MQRLSTASILMLVVTALARPAVAENYGTSRTYMLQEISNDEVFPRFAKTSQPPVTLQNNADLTVQILGGAVELRPDRTFALQLDLRVRRGGHVQAGPWQVGGHYRLRGADELELASADKTGPWDMPSFMANGTFDQHKRYGRVLSLFFEFELPGLYSEKVSCVFK